VIFAVGDIHGDYWRLVNLLAKLPMSDDDLLVFVGDYIDRGPDSFRVIELLIELRANRSRTVFLRGNHEAMLLDARAHPHSTSRYALWMGNGGAETLDSYPAGKPWWSRIPDEHWTFFESTGIEYWIEDFAFVHAGFLPPDAEWGYDEDPRLWIREPFLTSSHDFGARVVFGHTPQRSGRPLVKPNMIGIDTGVAYGGPLTAVGLTGGTDEIQVFQV
jgi:serine/threonine protein phosphatase 1